jgi:hypothetical protein
VFRLPVRGLGLARATLYTDNRILPQLAGRHAESDDHVRRAPATGWLRGERGKPDVHRLIEGLQAECRGSLAVS